MVEALKRSVDMLQAPDCPACRLGMIWYRAERRPPKAISHFFHCSDCGKVDEVKTSSETHRPLSDAARFFAPSNAGTVPPQ